MRWSITFQLHPSVILECVCVCTCFSLLLFGLSPPLSLRHVCNIRSLSFALERVSAFCMCDSHNIRHAALQERGNQRSILFSWWAILSFQQVSWLWNGAACVHVLGYSLCVCVWTSAGKSSVMIRKKSIQGGSKQTIELFEGESHFPEQFQRTAKLQITCLHPNVVASLFPQSDHSCIIILYIQLRCGH